MSTKKAFFEEILAKPFSLDGFVKFSKEFFNNLEMINPETRLNDYWNWSEFSFYIGGYYHIANFIGSDNAKIAVFAVTLKDRKNLDRARSMQRNFVKKLMGSAKIDGAIVAFYAENESKWRLSFIKLDYGFAKGKVTEKITPAKRYSYLVGEGEPCHTAGERLYPIFMNENTNPTIAEIEDAFSVEKVTKEFFEFYKDKYFHLKEHLESNEDFVAEAKRLNFTSEQFAKKLMGQIAFLYFIQKKGWLGVNVFPKSLTKKQYDNAFYSKGKASKEVVPKVFKQTGEDEYRPVAAEIDKLSREEQETVAASVKGQPWGTGPRKFIRRLFEVSVKNGENFYDEYLEPLFYEALNEKRGANDYYYKLKCRVPFLNGGLFEPLDNYDWWKNKFSIPNEMFSNIDAKGNLDADGILDIFDRYNFTMNEDEPLEKEVAIDPEMLGKIFENLLDAKDRKSKGAFYTPREIVHYMCQESLVNYLVTVTGISYDAVKDFIIYGEFMKDEDTTRQAKEGIGELYISKEILDRENNVSRLKDIDDALANIKVADPAVGSGAFPLGMISEIVRARRNITEYIAMLMDNKNTYAKIQMYQSTRHPLTLKLHTIKNSIFAVDIEPSAVDITKLRLWLSLVVEQEINESNDDDGLYAESKNPKPLPNLDCNIRCGNSLIDEIDGIKLIKETELLGNSEHQFVFGQNQYESLLNQLFEARDRLFYEKNHDGKDELKKKIRAITDRIIMFNIGGNPAVVEKYNSLKNESSPPYFVWQLEFARVFKEKGGFDVVIGNPPYIHLEHIKEQSQYYKELNFSTYEARGDIYSLFYEKGVALLRDNGILCYITSNKWMRSAYGKSLRKFFAEKTNPLQLIDFAGQQIFDATVDTNIILLSKSENTQDTNAVTIKEKESIANLSVYIKQNGVATKFGGDESWTILSPIEQGIKAKIEAVGTPLKDWDIRINYGIKTGCNEAFIIDGSVRDRLINADPKSDEIIRPILRGRDIKRYEYEWAGLYVIMAYYGSHKIIPIEYPAIYTHLKQYEDKLKARGQCRYTANGSPRVDADKVGYPGQHHWLELDNNPRQEYMDDFSKQKIVYREISMNMDAMIDDNGYFVNNKCYLITGKHMKYLCSFLNSKIFTIILNQVNFNGGKGPEFIKSLCVIKPSPEQDKALSDDDFYKMYQLTDEEINFISSSDKSYNL